MLSAISAARYAQQQSMLSQRHHSETPSLEAFERLRAGCARVDSPHKSRWTPMDTYMRSHSNETVRLPSALLLTRIERAFALNPMQCRCAWLTASIKPRSSR